MAGLNETAGGNRITIAFFGLRNAGKSTLVNAFVAQPLAIVSDTPGTTTDPVSKAMELPVLGPCTIIDTAGLDDVGELGLQRVKRTLAVLAVADIAVWVWGGETAGEIAEFEAFRRRAAETGAKVVEYRRGEDIGEFRKRVAAVKPETVEPGLLDGVVKRGDRVLCVCPIDESAPKGRLILPQVQVIRACLDIGAEATVCLPEAVRDGFDLVVTDSQAFGEVAARLSPESELTGFSILFARQKGDLAAYLAGLERVATLKDGDRVLVAEGCTHHRQCGDIGSVRIPAAIRKLSGANVEFVFASGRDFPEGDFALAVQCGGCMLTRREMLRRIETAKAKFGAITNYGLVLAKAAGVEVGRCVRMLKFS
jgi:small GTP-binding protein